MHPKICGCNKTVVNAKPRVLTSGDWKQELSHVLQKWRGTPYHPAGRTPKAGASCYGFVVGVMDELHGSFHPLPRVHHQLAFSRPEQATRLALQFCDFYPHVTFRADEWTPEPGDVMLIRVNTGIGHAGIIDADVRKVWHADGGSTVHFSGTDFWRRRLVRAFRSTAREQWQRCS